jgi:predicted phage tail protein
MSTIEIADMCENVAATDIRPITEAELDAINGGFLGVLGGALVGAAAFTTGFFAGYGAVRYVQEHL